MYRFNTAGLLLARFTSSYLNSSHGGWEVRRYGAHKVLSRKVVRLTCDSTAKGGICQVYLVGTAHYQQKYCRLVKDVVNFVKPQVVFLELCSRRTYVLKPHKPNNRFLSKKTANEPVVISEFQVAFEEAQKYGATVVLGDEPTRITFKRLNRRLDERTHWHRIKNFFSVKLRVYSSKILNYYYADVIKEEEVKYRNDCIGVSVWMRCLPILRETLIEERDQYMSAMLLKVAREHESVVAVVGSDHLPGLQKYWNQNIKVEGQPLVFWSPQGKKNCNH